MFLSIRRQKAAKGAITMDELISYKAMLDRPVDHQDLQEIAG